MTDKKSIAFLFSKGKSTTQSPLNAKYFLFFTPQAELYFLVSVPKKKIHRAVDRNNLKRKIREAFRLNKNKLLFLLSNKPCLVQIALIYQNEMVLDYKVIQNSVVKILEKITYEVAKSNN